MGRFNRGEWDGGGTSTGGQPLPSVAAVCVRSRTMCSLPRFYPGPAPRSPDVSQMSPINRRFPHVVIKVHKTQAANMNKRVAL